LPKEPPWGHDDAYARGIQPQHGGDKALLPVRLVVPATTVTRPWSSR